jgi:hypothetical protein
VFPFNLLVTGSYGDRVSTQPVLIELTPRLRTAIVCKRIRDDVVIEAEVQTSRDLQDWVSLDGPYLSSVARFSSPGSIEVIGVADSRAGLRLDADGPHWSGRYRGETLQGPVGGVRSWVRLVFRILHGIEVSAECEGQLTAAGPGE